VLTLNRLISPTAQLAVDYDSTAGQLNSCIMWNMTLFSSSVVIMLCMLLASSTHSQQLAAAVKRGGQQHMHPDVPRYPCHLRQHFHRSCNRNQPPDRKCALLDFSPLAYQYCHNLLRFSEASDGSSCCTSIMDQACAFLLSAASGMPALLLYHKHHQRWPRSSNHHLHFQAALPNTCIASKPRKQAS
jgi:hypothetical protein